MIISRWDRLRWLNWGNERALRCVDWCDLPCASSFMMCIFRASPSQTLNRGTCRRLWHAIFQDIDILQLLSPKRRLFVDVTIVTVLARGSFHLILVAVPPDEKLPISVTARNWQVCSIERQQPRRSGSHDVPHSSLLRRSWRCLCGSSPSWPFGHGQQLRTMISLTPGRQSLASHSQSLGRRESTPVSISYCILWQDIRTMYQLLLYQLPVRERKSS